MPKYEQRRGRKRFDLMIITIEQCQIILSVISFPSPFNMPLQIDFENDIRSDVVCGFEWTQSTLKHKP